MRTAPITINHRIQVSDDAAYLTAGQVRVRYGSCSHMWLIRRMQDSAFPAPTYFGRLRFWRLSDLEAWEREQAAKTAKRAPTGSQ
jgi:predicted DNA-binding transcriptional regulator AlpA